MTTVCFRDATMASDSKCTDGWGAFTTKTRKIDRLASGALLGQAGDADAREIIKLLSAAKKPEDLPSRAELAATKTDFDGILVFPSGEVFYIYVYVLDHGSEVEWTGQVLEVQEGMAAVGSGAQFALGAMAAGKSAADAVAIACHYDSASGLPVQEVPLRKGKRDGGGSRAV
jgi:ATP-dependent protease HslVU (ClpYQ) peptidase subunit